MAGTFEKPEIVQEEVDILMIGGGMACCGAAYEIVRWAEAAKAEKGVNLKIKLIVPVALEVGLRFAIREGGRTVGAGVITKMMN